MKTLFRLGLLLFPLLAIAGTKEKIAAEIDSVNESMHQLRKNITICDKNIRIIQGEVRDLEALIVEHKNLKDQHKNYIAETNRKRSEKEIDLKTALAEEKALNAKAGNAPSEADAQALNLIKEKKKQLELWFKEADVKVKKVQGSQNDVEKGIAQTEIRIQKAEEEIETTKKSSAEFEKLLAQYAQRKAALEKLAKKQQ